MTRERSKWIDSLRFLAIFLIMTVHFLSSYKLDAISPWRNSWTQYVLYGVSGKLAVAFFCVLLGYFASKPTTKDTGKYIVNRYLQFSVNILMIYVLFIAAFYALSVLGITPVYEY